MLGSKKRKKKKTAFRTALLASVGILVLTVMILLRRVLTPVIVALALAYIIDPMLIWLERHGVRRLISTIVLYTAGLGLITFACVALGPRVWQQGRNFYVTVSSAARNYGNEMLTADETGQADTASNNDDDETASPAEDVQNGEEESDQDGIVGFINKSIPDWGAEARRYIREHSDEIVGNVSSLIFKLGRNAAQGISSAADFVFGLIVVLIFTFFFMLHFQDMVQTVRRYIPAAHHDRTLNILHRIDAAASNFFRGRLLVCVVAALVYVTGLRISGIEYWLLIGIVGGILGFVPIIGVVLPLIPAAAFALLTDSPWFSLLGVLITFSAVQWVVEPVAATFILSKQVKMHPVTIILALLVGGSLFGLFGLLLSVPLAAVVRILGEEFVLPELRNLANSKSQEPAG